MTDKTKDSIQIIHRNYFYNQRNSIHKPFLLDLPALVLKEV